MNYLLSSNFAKGTAILLGMVLVMVLGWASVMFGLTNITWEMVVDSYTKFNGSHEHLIIQTTRVPRAFIAIVVGASLAVSGALMQALTRNPLASPDIFGLNAGASFFIVFAVTFLSMSSLELFKWVAFFGAFVAALAIYILGSFGRNGLTPMKLTLAGASIAALFSSLTKGMLSINETGLEEVLFWLAGSVEGRELEMLYPVLPYLGIAWVGSMLLSHKINILLMGDDVAKGLGQRVVLIKAMTWLIVVILAGGSVAIAGPIGFIGIVVPHLVRSMVGVDHRWVIPFSAICGAMMLLLADIGARYIIMPKEVPVGVMTALIGTPFFIYIARKGFNRK